MDSVEEIHGEKILNLLHQLEKEKTILRIHLLGRQQFERLTIITGQEKKDDETCFLIDRPEGLAERVREGEECRLFFEFIDKKKIHYSFRTHLKQILGESMLVHLPQSIRRLQRRKNFRIIPPPDTQLHFKLNEKTLKFGVVNLSQSGALIQQTIKEHRKHSGENLFQGLSLNNLKLVCPREEAPEIFLIQQAKIERAEKDIPMGHFLYGLSFIKMEKKEEKNLGTFIYECQREEIRKRGLNGYTGRSARKA